MINIKIKCQEDLMPIYATKSSAGADLKSSEDGEIKPSEIKLIKTGVFLEIPDGYEAQIRPRSGLALKYGVTMVNSPGTIDSDYRGEIGIIMINHGKETFSYKRGDRIAQIVFAKVTQCNFINSENLSVTERGTGGFGHTGV